MSGITINVEFQRRRAVVDVNRFWEIKSKIPMGPTTCHVLGLMQDSSDEGSYPVFVCELDDGQVITQSPETVRFVDTKDGELL